jgi:hypothetical protein
MENNGIYQYEETFFFRKRIHTLVENGIRTSQNDFFISSDILTKFENLGYQLQYKSDLKLFEVATVITFLVLGVKGLIKDPSDNILCSISIILIATAAYWLISIVFKLEYIGSFYFSNSTEKTKGGFEIKSRYPPSGDLQNFLHQIRVKRMEIAVDQILDSITSDSNIEEIESEQAAYLKKLFAMDADEFSLLLDKIRQKHQSKTNK